MTVKEISDLYLDLKAVSSLNSSESKVIHDYYRDMISYANMNSPELSQTFYNTLKRGGYIKDIRTEERDEKIEQING